MLQGFGTKKDSEDHLSRGVFISTSPIGGAEINSDADGGGVIFMKMPPIENVNGNGALLLQLAHFSGTTAKGLCKIQKFPIYGLSSIFSHFQI